MTSPASAILPGGARLFPWGCDAFAAVHLGMTAPSRRIGRARRREGR